MLSKFDYIFLTNVILLTIGYYKKWIKQNYATGYMLLLLCIYLYRKNYSYEGFDAPGETILDDGKEIVKINSDISQVKEILDGKQVTLMSGNRYLTYQIIGQDISVMMGNEPTKWTFEQTIQNDKPLFYIKSDDGHYLRMKNNGGVTLDKYKGGIGQLWTKDITSDGKYIFGVTDWTIGEGFISFGAMNDTPFSVNTDRGGLNQAHLDEWNGTYKSISQGNITSFKLDNNNLIFIDATTAAETYPITKISSRILIGKKNNKFIYLEKRINGDVQLYKNDNGELSNLGAMGNIAFSDIFRRTDRLTTTNELPTDMTDVLSNGSDFKMGSEYTGVNYVKLTDIPNNCNDKYDENGRRLSNNNLFSSFDPNKQNKCFSQLLQEQNIPQDNNLIASLNKTVDENRNYISSEKQDALTWKGTAPKVVFNKQPIFEPFRGSERFSLTVKSPLNSDNLYALPNAIYSQEMHDFIFKTAGCTEKISLDADPQIKQLISKYNSLVDIATNNKESDPDRSQRNLILGQIQTRANELAANAKTCKEFQDKCLGKPLISNDPCHDPCGNLTLNDNCIQKQWTTAGCTNIDILKLAKPYWQKVGYNQMINDMKLYYDDAMKGDASHIKSCFGEDSNWYYVNFRRKGVNYDITYDEISKFISSLPKASYPNKEELVLVINGMKSGSAWCSAIQTSDKECGYLCNGMTASGCCNGLYGWYEWCPPNGKTNGAMLIYGSPTTIKLLLDKGGYEITPGCDMILKSDVDTKTSNGILYGSGFGLYSISSGKFIETNKWLVRSSVTSAADASKNINISMKVVNPMYGDYQSVGCYKESMNLKQLGTATSADACYSAAKQQNLNSFALKDGQCYASNFAAFDDYTPTNCGSGINNLFVTSDYYKGRHISYGDRVFLKYDNGLYVSGKRNGTIMGVPYAAHLLANLSNNSSEQNVAAIPLTSKNNTYMWFIEDPVNPKNRDILKVGDKFRLRLINGYYLRVISNRNDYSSESKGKYLPSCTSDNCQNHGNLDSAFKACDKLGSECNGVTRHDSTYQTRSSNTLYQSPTGESAWMKGRSLDGGILCTPLDQSDIDSFTFQFIQLN